MPEQNTNSESTAVLQRDIGYVRASIDQLKQDVKDALKEMRDLYASRERVDGLEANMKENRIRIETIESRGWQIVAGILLSLITGMIAIYMGVMK